MMDLIYYVIGFLVFWAIIIAVIVFFLLCLWILLDPVRNVTYRRDTGFLSFWGRVITTVGRRKLFMAKLKREARYRKTSPTSREKMCRNGFEVLSERPCYQFLGLCVFNQRR